MERCPWCLINEKETLYHDTVWGTPVREDRMQFHHLTMEVMQCGLSWDLILQREEVLASCFADFDYDAVAAFGEEDVERILAVPGMIRARRKIQAVVSNAQVFQQIREECGSFSAYLWGWTGNKTLLYRGHSEGHMVATNVLSERISRDLKRRGMKFVGPVTIYSHLQACGLINDHLSTCFRYPKLLQETDWIAVEEDFGQQ